MFGKKRPPSLNLNWKGFFFWMMLWLGVAFLLSGMIIQKTASPKTISITNNELYDLLEKNPKNIAQITIDPESRLIRGNFSNSDQKFISSATDLADVEKIARKNNVIVVSEYRRNNFWVNIFWPYLFPVILILFFLMWLGRRMGGGIKGINFFSKASYEKKIPQEKFDDVAGIDEAVQSVSEVIDFLKCPEKFQKMGAKIPQGILLVGPPGTGKTSLARAVAGEAGVPFYSISGSHFIEMFVGVGASRVRDIFKNAKENAPSIIFIDELDAIGKRSIHAGIGGHNENDQTVTELGNQMSGFSSNEAVVVMAATNRPDSLDEALLRPGRFTRQIVVDRPDYRGRKEILKLHASTKPLDGSVDLAIIAKITAGATGADLENLLNEAAILTVRRNRSAISQKEIEDALEVVAGGVEKRNKILSPEEKKRVAVHEVGHALVAKFTLGCDAVAKISIIARTGGSLGFTRFLPKDQQLLTQGYCEGELAVLMGGTAAEDLILGERSSGAASDIERATEIARTMVHRWGMSKKVGMMNLARAAKFLSGEEFIGSSQTAFLADQEIKRLIDEAFAKATMILEAHRQQVEKLVEALLQKENISREEMENIIKTA